MMPSMPPSPLTPSRSRPRPPSIDLSSTSPSLYAGNGFSPSQPPETPRSSLQHSPLTPRQPGSRKMANSFSMSSGMDAVDDAGGMGSLADELADAWGNEEEDGEVENAYFDDTANGDPRTGHSEESMVDINDMHDMGFGMALGTSTSLQSAVSQSPSTTEASHLQPLASPIRTNHQSEKASKYQRSDSKYDGSDYGPDSDLEDVPTIPPSLAAKMANIEGLARLGLGDDGTSLIPRVTKDLHDLSAQSSVENGASRLMTAHSSLTSHLTHQTRSLHTLTHPLLFSSYPVLSEEAIDELVPLIDDLRPTLPFPPQPTPLLSLQILISNTADLMHTLRGVSDTLHESRQTTSTASRRLKAARDLVTEIQREEQERETARRFIERGRWGERLASREAGRVCGEVVEGFERVCDGLRAKLVGEVAAG